MMTPGKDFGIPDISKACELDNWNQRKIQRGSNPSYEAEYEKRLTRFASLLNECSDRRASSCSIAEHSHIAKIQVTGTVG